MSIFMGKTEENTTVLIMYNISIDLPYFKFIDLQNCLILLLAVVLEVSDDVCNSLMACNFYIKQLEGGKTHNSWMKFTTVFHDNKNT